MECFLHVLLIIFTYFNITAAILMACALLGDFLFYLCSKSYRPKLFYPFLDGYRFRSSQNEENAEGLELVETDINAEIEIIETTEGIENSDPQVSNFLLFFVYYFIYFPFPILLNSGKNVIRNFFCFCRAPSFSGMETSIDNSALERIS
jgi:hypothetical protein